MKLTNISIDAYRNLFNLDFDFTHPEDHPQAGQPLTKICLIGQSATGKTSILDLIKSAIDNIQNARTVNRTAILDNWDWNALGNITFESPQGLVNIGDRGATVNGHFYEVNSTYNGTVGSLDVEDANLAYISADLLSSQSLSIFEENPADLYNGEPNFKDLPFQYLILSRKTYSYVFDHQIEKKKLFQLLYEILEYRKSFTQMAAELIHKGAIGDPNKLTRLFQDWAAKNKNPLEPFAAFFNPILKKLGLEIDLVNTEYSIPIRLIGRDEVMPIRNLSTGTKALLLSMFPIFQLNTSDAIILLDEPERSLFPDIQIELMSHYRQCAGDAQFIVATHSPFIAAAFEPFERFILYFDEGGKVQVRRGSSPIGDDPNDILRNDFNVDYYNDFGKQAYNRYRQLQQAVLTAPDSATKASLMAEAAKLGDEYNF